MRETVDASSWAFMKLLREHNDTKKVYEVDPYAEVYQLRENIYGILTLSADGMGDPWMYLIVGPEKALLIDTSFGIGDLKGLVHELIGDMPLYVANTHTSYDHSYGNCQFPRCYCHKYEYPTMEEKQDPHIWDYLFDEAGNGKWLDFDRKDIIPFQRYEIVAVEDGYTFDLGGDYQVELIWVPGHKPGHAMFLDKKSRLLFAGDDVIGMRVGIGKGSPYATVEAYRDEMRKLSARLGEFDFVFTGHFTYDLESSVVLYLLETAEAIVADPRSYDIVEEVNGQRRYQKYVRNMGTIAYTATNVYKNQEAAL
jgi:glyoxylase-like metal-dependent hydrolase (beta-lactamase superfamily II)